MKENLEQEHERLLLENKKMYIEKSRFQYLYAVFMIFFALIFALITIGMLKYCFNEPVYFKTRGHVTSEIRFEAGYYLIDIDNVEFKLNSNVIISDEISETVRKGDYVDVWESYNSNRLVDIKLEYYKAKEHLSDSYKIFKTIIVFIVFIVLAILAVYNIRLGIEYKRKGSH